MTKEEIKDELYRMLSDVNNGYPIRANTQKDRYKEAVKIAIEALEQESIIDKIRAKIVEYKDNKIIHAERNEMIDTMLDIIDKYKAESED